MLTKYYTIINSSLNGQFLLIDLKLICLIQHFEADFLWKVSLKILNSEKSIKLSPMKTLIFSILYLCQKFSLTNFAHNKQIGGLLLSNS